MRERLQLKDWTLYYLRESAWSGEELNSSALLEKSGAARAAVRVPCDFEQVLMFYNSAVYSVGDIIETWVYRVGLGKMQYSVGSAVSLLKAIISMVLIIGANAFSRKVAGRGMW